MRVPTVAAAILGAFILMVNAAQAQVVITVDKAAQRMTVTVNGEERHRWPVSTGMAGYATPAGSFVPSRLVREHYSREWDNAPMPHSIFFTDQGHAIHGSNATGRLGSRASHGCVRLSPPMPQPCSSSSRRRASKRPRSRSPARTRPGLPAVRDLGAITAV